MTTMPKSTLAIFGATGNQGNSVANFVLSSPTLSTRYTVRAISRNTAHHKMLDLASKGATLVQADMDDASTLPSALRGATHLFLMTNTSYTTATREMETRQARTVCTAALAAGVSYIIFSSMSHPAKLTNGALNNVDHFDVKAEIEAYIRGLPVQSAFFAPASFMQNYMGMMAPRPAPENDGTYVLADMLEGDTRMPFIDITETGKWVGAILADPDKYAGCFFAAAEGFYGPDQAAEIMSKVTGKTVRHVRLPDEVVKAALPDGFREQLFEMFLLNREYGYYGPGQEEMVKWAREQVDGEVTGLEAFLRRVGLTLE
ncbi:hypothetical protein TW65_09124 [Stemphylium lycopersici]|uniref:NAD(P)-binding protein n=1 Tax=Stemphylium lycopersici TaxID=183478 RepID=A0A364N736_STELY|nr:hypothetical protein TW65_09124 [Stemphylium lycopersici]RAR13119.1 NAD(P)-binding protein [Stemphylium lycopersici]